METLTLHCACGGVYVNTDKTAPHLMECTICKKVRDDPRHDYGFIGFG